MPASRRSRRGRRPIRDRLVSLLDYELLWTVLAIGVIIAAIAPQLDFRVRQYVPGDIATADITAPTDFEVRDPVSTERRRAEEVAGVPDVYDFDPGAAEAARLSLRALFAWGRQARSVIDSSWPELDEGERAALVQTAREAAGRALSEGLVSTLWDDPHGFSLATELALAGALSDFHEENRIGGLEPTLADGGEALIVRNIADQEEARLSNLSSVLSLEQARRQVRARVVERLENQQVGELPGPETVVVLGELGATLVRPNLTYNSNETQARRQEAYASVPPVFYQVKRGRTLLRAGDEVTDQAILELEALREQVATDRSLLSLTGSGLLIALAVVALWRYVLHYQRRFRFQKVGRLYLLTLVVLVGMVVVTRLALFVAGAIAGSMAQEPFTVVEAYQYGIPFAAGGLLLLLLVDVQIAWAFSATYAVVVGVMTQSLGLTVFALMSSLAAIYGMSQYKQRTALVQAGTIVGGVNAAAAVGLALLVQPPPPWTIIGFEALCAMAGGVMVAMLVTTTMPPLEHCFQCLTDIKLLELSNMNLPLLKELAVAAPGTYHHSVVVGTLAEKAAEAVGVNPLFARVAAYYHDIGKLRQPGYFIENQREGQNPHERLTPHMSALVLVAHVKDGVAYAEEHGLPQPLIDMIPQHHGTRLISFFYDKARQAAEDGDAVDPEEFRYPGPKPQSKEAGILMLADSVEAISRTLDEPTSSRLRTMIQRTIRDVVDDDQLSECSLTLADLSGIGDAFLGVLAGMHHQRVEYPSSERPTAVEVGFHDEDRGTQLPDQTYH